MRLQWRDYTAVANLGLTAMRTQPGQQSSLHHSSLHGVGGPPAGGGQWEVLPDSMLEGAEFLCEPAWVSQSAFLSLPATSPPCAPESTPHSPSTLAGMSAIETASPWSLRQGYKDVKQSFLFVSCPGSGLL